MITINVKVIGENVKLISSPTVASKSIETIQIHFDFDNEWDNFGKIAIFWGADSNAYTSQIINGTTTVPHEVIAEHGKIKFGVYGTNGNKRIVSAKTTYVIVDGSYASVASESIDPSPDIIDQIETGIGELESMIKKLAPTITKVLGTDEDYLIGFTTTIESAGGDS